MSRPASPITLESESPHAGGQVSIGSPEGLRYRPAPQLSGRHQPEGTPTAGKVTACGNTLATYITPTMIFVAI